jgi:hypothetical protein
MTASHAVKLFMSTVNVANVINLPKTILPSINKESTSGNQDQTYVTTTGKTHTHSSRNSHAKPSVQGFKSNELTSTESVLINAGSEHSNKVNSLLVETSTRESPNDVLGFESTSPFEGEIQMRSTSESGIESGIESVDSVSYSEWIHSTVSYLTSTATSLRIRLESSVTLSGKDMLSSSESSYTFDQYDSSDISDTSYSNDESELPYRVTSTLETRTIIQPLFRG